MAKAQYIEEIPPSELAGEFVEICRERIGAFFVDSALKKRFQAVMDRAFGTPPLKEYVKRVFLKSRKGSKLLPEYLKIDLRKKEWGIFDREKVEEVESGLLLYLSTEGSLSFEDLDFWRAQIEVFYGQPEVILYGQPEGSVIPFKRSARRRPTAKNPKTTAKRRQRK